MKYKGYIGQVEYDGEAKIFHGEILGIKDVITFQGTSVRELEKAFRDSIDDYLTWCEERSEEPEKPFSGTFTVRVNPEEHKKLALAASKANTSLNKFVAEAAAREAERLIS